MNEIQQDVNLDQGSVVEKILDDQINIDSLEEFKDLLEVFPDDPDLYRKFADLCSQRNKREAALMAYHKASARYLDAGMVLQSIVAKILAWSIVQPTHREGRRFHERVHRQGGGDKPAQILFSQLDYTEMVALMLRLARVRLAPGEVVYESGSEAKDIYFIIAGELTETAPRRKRGSTAPTIALGENDIFGDIFPLEERSFCRGRVVATTAVELVKIAKPVLRASCYRYPRIRELLERLSRIRLTHDRDRTWQTVRRSCRYCLPADVKLELKTTDAEQPQLILGTSRDLSTGGICVALTSDTPRSEIDGLLKKKTTLTILEGTKTVIDRLAGHVIWLKTVGDESHPTTLIGVAFDPMAEETAIALNAFCTISNDEQEMIWSLWNHLVRH